MPRKNHLLSCGRTRVGPEAPHHLGRDAASQHHVFFRPGAKLQQKCVSSVVLTADSVEVPMPKPAAFREERPGPSQACGCRSFPYSDLNLLLTLTSASRSAAAQRAAPRTEAPRSWAARSRVARGKGTEAQSLVETRYLYQTTPLGVELGADASSHRLEAHGSACCSCSSL